MSYTARDFAEGQEEMVQISKAQLDELLKGQQQKPAPKKEPQRKSQKILLKMNPKKEKFYINADVETWTEKAFSWDQNVQDTLQVTFGKDKFRQNQRAIVNLVLSNKDVFALMPTGYGKSITFQIPACIEQGVTIVIMPLISLIYDQTTYLESIGVTCANVSGAHMQPTVQQILDKGVKMIYTTPEKLENSGNFKTLLTQLHERHLLKRFVIDEAHCVSKWGRDFRPDYLKLTNIRPSYKNVPIMALTATAPQEVKEDIIEVLKMKGCEYLEAPFNRPNLIYQVKPRETSAKTTQDIKHFIEYYYPKQSGIIYCLTQNDCESISKQLQQLRVSAKFYHAGLTEKIRNEIHKDWLINEVMVIVATVAFGMGIDKKDCRFVIHYQMPKSIENYYQESGRAGRDGKTAHCILYYSNQDYKTNLFMIDRDGLEKSVRQHNIKKLEQMQSYCYDQTNCRRVLQLSYLGQQFNKDDCGNDVNGKDINAKCDNCSIDTSTATERDVTNEAHKILESVLYFPITEAQLITVLKGTIDKKQKQRQFSQGTENIFGLLKSDPKTIPILLQNMRNRNLFTQSIKEFNQGGYKRKVVYLTTTRELIYSLDKLLIQVLPQKKQSIVESSIPASTRDMFKKYLNNDLTKKNEIQWNWQNAPQQKPQQLQLLQYNEIYGYLTEIQFEEINDRLLLVRKSIYKSLNQEQLNIEHVLSTDDIGELCKKLPMSLEELNDNFIRIAIELKKKPYMKSFIDEIKHYVDLEEIDKSKFAKPQQIEKQKEFFEFQKYQTIEEEQLAPLDEDQRFSNPQKFVEELIGQPDQMNQEDYDLLNYLEELEQQQQQQRLNESLTDQFSDFQWSSMRYSGPQNVSTNLNGSQLIMKKPLSTPQPLPVSQPFIQPLIQPQKSKLQIRTRQFL